MAELAKKIWFRTDIIPPTAVKIYTTVAETGSTVTLPLKVDGVQGYVGLVDKSNSLWTPIKVKKGGTTYYAASSGGLPKGTLIADISTTKSFTVPAGVYFVSLNWVGDFEYSGAKGSGIERGCAVKRVAVRPNTTYTIGFTDYNYNINAADYYAGYFAYYNSPLLGYVIGIDPVDTMCSYKVYADVGTGTLFIDSAVRTRYKTLTGGNLPT